MSPILQCLRWFGTRDFLPMRLRLGVLHRLAGSRRLLPTPFTARLADSGYRYQGVLSDWMDWNVFFLGGYKRSIVNLIRQVVQATTPAGTAVFVDVGAAVGQMTMSASPLAAKVIAFEPSPAVAAIFREHVRLNGLTNVILIEAALGPREDQATFYVGASSKGTGSLQPDANGDDKTPLVVPVRRGDNVMEELRLTRLDLLKVDAQGVEIGVLEGFSATIARDHPTVILSLPYIVNGSPAEMARLREVLGQGYALFLVRNQLDWKVDLIDLGLHTSGPGNVIFVLGVHETRREAIEKRLSLPARR
jgi:FkbM family methyltransferase